MKQVSLFLLTILLIFTINIIFFAGGRSSVINAIGDISLGMSKNQIIKILGEPNSPIKHDFVYGSGDKEMIIIFDEDEKAESIIIKGKKLKYNIIGIKIGSSSNKVENAFGKPERVKKYLFSKREIWNYPSSNVYFSLKKGKIISFAVSSSDHKGISKSLRKKL